MYLIESLFQMQMSLILNFPTNHYVYSSKAIEFKKLISTILYESQNDIKSIQIAYQTNFMAIHWHTE